MRWILIIWMSALLSAQEYYAKIEPYEIRTIAANVSGLILFTDETMEGNTLSKEHFIQMDDELDRIELEQVNEKIVLLRRSLELNEALVANHEAVLAKKRDNMERIAALKMKSQIEKDNEYYGLITSENSLIATQKEIISLQTQINDLTLRKAQLERSIRDKSLSAPGFVLYSLLVRPGQVVSASTPLAKIADRSRALLTFFLSREDAAAAGQKVVYLDGIKSDHKIERLWTIADEQHLSSYKAQIVVPAPKQFSGLVKVELRDE
ncbi:MAG: HlyD family efflux transporter periplasmic adaptor subunit [Campylobacterales bacterium]|nr:HlyD family efflux transporter periplasmic adaptor subunit [Campylobacterales bacterium]